MKNILSGFRTYFIPIFVVVLVVCLCSCFLINNIPYNSSALDVNMSKRKIIISNDLLLTDTMGKTLNNDNSKLGVSGYSEIEITSTVDGKVKYELVLDKERVEQEIPLQYVKVYLTNENNNPVKGYDRANIPTFYDLKISDKNPSAKILYSGVLKNKEKKHFKVRMWTADTYELIAKEYIFSTKISVKIK